MKSVLLSVLIIVSFFGCSYKHDSLYVGNKKVTEQSVANTKKMQIMEDGKVKIFITVTYLDSINGKKIIDENREQFVVGVHFVNFGTKEIGRKLEPKDIKCTIEDETHLVSIKKLNPRSSILKIIPASNPWSQYFLVETRKIDKNRININLRISPYSAVSLRFEKNY